MQSVRNLFLIILSIVFSTHVGIAQEVKFPFQNPKLSLEERLEDLTARMTLEEKAGQLMYNAPAIPRLNIPAYNWWNECLHGVARNGRATVFPQAIGIGATFDTDLVFRMSSAIADEARAKYNVSIAKNLRDQYRGLTFWTPNVNLFRDPRWGRGQETYGEDPYLISRIGVAFVKGLQGDNPDYIKAAGCAKHFAVHSGPEALRHEFNAEVNKKDLWETYLPAFEALVKEAKVEGVMGAYNRTNGELCCASPYLMQEILRKQWGFKGYYTSDCWALVDFYSKEGHQAVKTAEEASALALNTGCNLNCGSTYPTISKAIEMGLTSETELNQNFKELTRTRFRLGMFDPIGSTPFDKIGAEVIRSDKHIALTKEAAVKSMVLLKNKDNLLPLDKDINSVFVTGPMATHAQALLANYYGLSENMVTILEGVVGKVAPHTMVKYSQGALIDRPNLNPMDWYSGLAGETEVTIACVGISQLIEGEEGESIASPDKGDRTRIRLPQNQIDFIKKIRGKAKKLVVVMTGGSAVACPEIYEMADAMVFIWYPGEQGGNAVADILFGDEMPSGRLPVSFPKSIEDLPAYEDYNMQGRTYRYATKEPLFPFGFGLSYTQFEYSDLILSSKKVKKGKSITASVKITNKGSRASEEVVQLYLKDMEASTYVPIHALKEFRRVYLKPGETKTVQFEITPKMMEMINDNGEAVIEKGDFKVFIGGSSPTQRSLDLGASPFSEAVFYVK